MCQAFFKGAYATFTALYMDAPRMSPYLMDALSSRVRHAGLRTLVNAYLPTLPLDFVMLQLGLETEDDARQLIVGARAVILEGALDAKTSRISMLRT